MSPSITISKSNILTLKEKFEPGSGINIEATDIIKESQIEFVKTSASQIAKKLNIKNYARIDMFFQLQRKQNNYNRNKHTASDEPIDSFI